MISRKAKATATGIAAVAVLACAVAAATELTLTLNGALASTRVRMIDGVAYVPISDVAKALGQTVARSSGGYTITPAGGANPIQGVQQGKIGDTLFTGKWRFQALGMKQMDSYKERYAQNPEDVRPAGPGETLVVVDVQMKNGLSKQEQALLCNNDSVVGNQTALTDDQGHSYRPLDYDLRARVKWNRSDVTSDTILPGAKLDMAVVFSVPQGTHPKNLVFTVQSDNDENKSVKGADVRVSLAP